VRLRTLGQFIKPEMEQSSPDILTGIGKIRCRRMVALSLHFNPILTRPPPPRIGLNGVNVSRTDPGGEGIFPYRRTTDTSRSSRLRLQLAENIHSSPEKCPCDWWIIFHAPASR